MPFQVRLNRYCGKARPTAFYRRPPAWPTPLKRTGLQPAAANQKLADAPWRGVHGITATGDAVLMHPKLAQRRAVARGAKSWALLEAGLIILNKAES